MNRQDTLSRVVEELRTELGEVRAELKAIEVRGPALRSREERIAQALDTLVGEGSTGDPAWLKVPRITNEGLERCHAPAPRKDKTKASPRAKMQLTDGHVLEAAIFIQSKGRPQRSAEIFQHLVHGGFLTVPEGSEMPTKAFGIRLGSIDQNLIVYDRTNKTWSLKDPSPKEKLRRHKSNPETRILPSSPIARKDHLFVRIVKRILDRTGTAMSSQSIYAELQEERDFRLNPQPVETYIDFIGTLA